MSQCNPDSDGFLTIGCMARGFSPADSLTFEWTDSNKHQLNEFVQYPAIGQNGDYTQISHIRLKNSDWVAKKAYKCTAKNSAGMAEAFLEKPEKHIIRPTITLISREDGDKILLECKLKAYYPDQLIVQWFTNEKPIIPSLPDEKFQNNEKGQKTFTRISHQIITTQNKSTQYTCQATFSSVEILKQTYNVCEAYSLSKFLMHVKKPHLRDIMKESEVTTSCIVEAPYNTEVSWLIDGISTKATSESKPVLPHIRMKPIVSNLTLPTETWLKLKTLVCTAKHVCFQKEEHVIEANDIKKVPVVEIRRPFTESTEAGSAVLECVVRDLPSGEACVIFQANGADISEVNYFDLTPSESIHSLATQFTIPSEHHKKENTFTCKVHTSSINHWVSKHTGNLFDDPTIELLVVPSVGQSCSQPKKLVCTGEGFKPKIRWLSKSQEKTDTVVDFTIRKDGRVKVYSEILVLQQEWSQGVAYTCEIVDRHIVKTANTSICSVTAHSSQLADVYLLGPSLSDVKNGTDVSLTCLVIGQGVNFSIEWKLDGNVSNLRDYTQRPEDHANGTQSMQSILKVPVRIWHLYTLFTCQVKHLCSGNLQQQNISKTRDPKKPTVRILRPSDSDLSGSQDVSLLCFITGFFPSDISVHWQLNGTQLDVSRFTNSPVVAHTARYYSMHSALKLPASQWMEGKYSCVVSHESSNDSIIATLENLYASLIHSAPSAQLLQGSNKLVCLAFGFSPSAINITWLLGMTELPDYRLTSPAKGPTKGPDGKFSIQSHLELLPSDWAPGEVYSCRVTHIADTLLLNISKPEIFKEAIFINENKHDDIAQDSVEESWNMACVFLILFLFSLLYGSTVTLIKVNPA